MHLQSPWHYLGKSSLRARMVALVVLVAVLSVVSLGGASYFMTRNIERADLERQLLNDLDRVNSQLDAEISRITQELQLLAHTPPIQGLVRTMTGSLLDPVDGTSTAANWRERLAAIFTSVHQVRPEYVQLRLIGLADGGREIVRVDKRGTNIDVIPDEGLQRKGDRDYVRIGSHLAPGEIHVTPVEWNRENGRIETPYLAVIRYVMPIFDLDGRRFGMLVVNVAAGHLVHKVTRRVAPGIDVLLLDGNDGGFVQRGDGSSTEILVESPPHIDAAVLKVVTRATDTPRIGYARGKIVAARQLDRVRPGGAPLRVALVADARVIAAGARRTSTIILIAGIAATLLAAILARVVTHRQLHPLLAMNSEIRAAETEMRRPRLPDTREDEIGQLARSFGRLLTRIAERDLPARTVFDEVQDSVLVIDDQNLIEDTNQSAAMLFGRPRSDLVGSGFCTLLASRSRNFSVCSSCQGRDGACLDQPRRLGADSNFLEFEAIDSNGRIFPVELSASRIETEGRTRRICIMRDISTRKAEEAERAKLISDLKASNSELDTFAYVASHDLKAPLRVIHNAVDWIEEDLEGTPNAEMRENLEILRSRADRMQKLLDALFEHARIGRKTGDTRADIVGGEELRDELLALASPPPDFDVIFDDRFSNLKLPRMPMQVVLLNTISNAIKHHDRDHGTIRVSVVPRGRMTEIHVSDDGPGIDPLYHDRIFGMFQTLKARDEIEGSGMGLAIARKHMKLAGGDIHVVSADGERGSTFVIRWPNEGAEAQSDAA